MVVDWECHLTYLEIWNALTNEEGVHVGVELVSTRSAGPCTRFPTLQ